jgi:hypothetical protein
VRDAIRDKAITGMSFRFRVISDEWGTDDGGDTRTIKEVELLEAGPVVFPAYEQTTVAVRSLVSHLDDQTRAVLAQELETVTHVADDAVSDDETDLSTSDVTSEPAECGSPDEPPAVSHEANRTRITEALARFRHNPKEANDVHQ